MNYRSLFLFFPLACLAFPTVISAQNKKHSNEMHPFWSPDGKMIVFYSNRAGNEDIYTISVETGQKTQLTNNISADSQPTWSPNGQYIAFESDRNGDYDIYIIRPDGTGLKRLTKSPLREMTPAWSPDGKKIVYEVDINGNWQLFTLDLKSGKTEQLTDTAKDHLAACWSLDGEEIFYSSSHRGAHQTDVEIQAIHLSKKKNRAITHQSGVSSNISIAEDISTMVFNTHRDGNWEIYSMELNGENLKRLTFNEDKRADFEFSNIDGEPALSPDGQKIAFLSGREGSFDICIMDIDGKNFKNLTKEW